MMESTTGQMEPALGPGPPQLESEALDSAEDLVQTVTSAMHAFRTFKFTEIPAWLRDNDFIFHGHRPELRSYWLCFRSMFCLHNETGNIWTHLLGAVLFAVLPFCTYLHTAPLHTSWTDIGVFSAFFSSAIICLSFSTAYHTFYCHSEQVGHYFKRLDYCGISVLIMGSYMPWVFYGFYCDTNLKIIYMGICLVLGTVTMVCSVLERFCRPDFRPFRALVFTLFGLSGVLPSLHWCLKYGPPSEAPPEMQHAIHCLLGMAALYILGAVVYALRVPERLLPGRCDFWFQSHQIFHVLVVAAAYTQHWGSTTMALYRLTENNGHCPLVSSPGELSSTASS